MHWFYIPMTAALIYVLFRFFALRGLRRELKQSRSDIIEIGQQAGAYSRELDEARRTAATYAAELKLSQDRQRKAEAEASRLREIMSKQSELFIAAGVVDGRR